MTKARIPFGSRHVPFLIALASIGCQRGCGWDWLREHGVGGPPPSASGTVPMNVLDCPDGLARCFDGTVEASRLLGIAQPCRGPESVCTCPWDRVGYCARGCAADGIEVVIDRTHAARQLCAPEPDANPNDATSWKRRVVDAMAPPAASCDEAQLYRCARGLVVDCAVHVVLAACTRGCFAEGAAIEADAQDESVSREAAFAILCSR